MIDLAFDMETQDPDDVLTLCVLATHPQVRLRAVTVSPGSRHQVGVVRHVLDRLERREVPVGSGRPDHGKQCVSRFHYRWLGDVPPADPDDLAWRVLADAHRDCPALCLVTGGPLTNVARFLEARRPSVRAITMQGGFAGDSVVPPVLRLPKFEGRETCPTFNMNGDVEAARAVLTHPGFGARRLVSKNVCHGVAWDRQMHGRMLSQRHAHPGLAMVVEAMDLYLERKPEGKLLHDPLAACVAVDPTIVHMREVEVYREKGEWGSRLKEGTGTFITVSVDRDRFERVLAGS
jgi:inosine-uridine nucleoside N-ribohydrolase